MGGWNENHSFVADQYLVYHLQCNYIHLKLEILTLKVDIVCPSSGGHLNNDLTVKWQPAFDYLWVELWKSSLTSQCIIGCLFTEMPSIVSISGHWRPASISFTRIIPETRVFEMLKWKFGAQVLYHSQLCVGNREKVACLPSFPKHFFKTTNTLLQKHI